MLREAQHRRPGHESARGPPDPTGAGRSPAICGKVAFSQTALHLCEQEATPSQEEFLLRVLESEMAHREEVRKARFLREAAFPVYKTLEGYEIQHLRLPASLSRPDLAAGRFIGEKKNLVLYGPVGTGKTHLAIALGVVACEAGIRTRFFTAAELVVRLSEAYRRHPGENAQNDPEGRAADHRRVGLRADRQAGRAAAVSDHLRQLRKEEPDHHHEPGVHRWGSIFTDDQMAAAMIDRLAHHGYILLFEGESYRMKHALMRQKQGSKIPTS